MEDMHYVDSNIHYAIHMEHGILFPSYSTEIEMEHILLQIHKSLRGFIRQVNNGIITLQVRCEIDDRIWNKSNSAIMVWEDPSCHHQPTSTLREESLKLALKKPSPTPRVKLQDLFCGGCWTPAWPRIQNWNWRVSLSVT